MIFRRILPLLVFTGTLLAFEDVSFSARTLGLGGDQSAVVDDAFSFFVNPALAARSNRPVIGLTGSPYMGTFYGVFGYTQPVKGLGTIGGSVMYFDYLPEYAVLSSGDGDARFFMALPLGKYFDLGFLVGTHSYWRSFAYPFYARFSQGPFASLGSKVSLLPSLTLAFSINELNILSLESSASHVGLAWQPHFKKSAVISSFLLAGDLGTKFSPQTLKVHAGSEVWFFKDILGLRVGMRYGTDEISGFSPTLGITLRTHRVEKTDFELHYATVLNYQRVDTSTILHQLSISVLFGDARKAEKDSIVAAQAERARRLREEALERERDRLRAELANIQNERQALERQREDIARMRKEALEKLARIAGVGVQDTDSLITITLSEVALRFDSTSVEIPFSQGYRTLSGVAAFLVNYPNNRIVVQVHTDNSPLPEEFKGTFRDTKALTAARAEVIKRYFVEVEGIADNRITARGLGDTRPLADNDTEEARAQNRRVEIVVIK